jgi:prepilin-type N-terminal cleavage/methylation domain-containing protein
MTHWQHESVTVDAMAQPPRAGFTIIELLISLGLMVLLMAGLYAAMSIYTDLQLDSHEEVTRGQVSRALLRQIGRDVQSVVFSPQDASDDSSADEDDEDSDADTSEVVADPSTSLGIYTNGIVGTATDLLLFVSRPDRNLNYVSAQEIAATSDRSSDTMIVRYLVADTMAGGLAAEIAERNAGGAFSGAYGLVRMSGDVYGLSTAVQEGDEMSQMSAAEVTAREVSAIAFQYFDGTAWQQEWDSTQLNMLPVAIEVVLTLRTPEPDDPTLPSPADDRYGLGETTHRMVFALPTAEPYVSESAL